MEVFFDMDPAVANPEILNQKIIQKVQSTIEKIKPEEMREITSSAEYAATAHGYSHEELKALRSQLDNVYEQLQKMNFTWDISNHVVQGNSRITKKIKQMIWKIEKKMLKPFVSSVSSCNSATTVTVSEIIRLQDMIISYEERRA